MDTSNRPSALQTILSMFRLSNTPTVPISDEELAGDPEEPPDQVPDLSTAITRDLKYCKSSVLPQCPRRESLLTKAITSSNRPDVQSQPQPRSNTISRALSTTSSQSIPSTAELTSDCELTSPARSASPSPPPPSTRLVTTLPLKHSATVNDKVVIAPATSDDKLDVAVVGEAAVEKTLGRKRCIMFACSDKPVEVPVKEAPPVPQTRTEVKPDAQPRKCRLTFMCPSRSDSPDSAIPMSKTPSANRKIRSVSPAPPVPKAATKAAVAVDERSVKRVIEQPTPKRPVPRPTFHEFASSQDETDSWVDKPIVSDQPKLTLDDVMRKENAIRQIGEEAEEEAEAEEREQEELENELDAEIEGEDDFAPSDDEDDNDSDDGNESDDEGGFAESEDESDGGSEYQFWAPSTTTAATSMDNLTHFSSRQRSRSSSLDSATSHTSSSRRTRAFRSRRASKPKAIRMRPGTPELPDSTDFVCGTLDEDRPLEAAFISCREQKKRERHILIPQDIDPSFPTSEPEQEDDDDDLEDDESEPVWLRDQFGAMDDDTRGRRRPSAIKLSPSHVAPQKIHQPQPVRPVPGPVRRTTNKSPAPQRLRSPPPRRLFGHSPSRRMSPAPQARYKSPRGSPANMKVALGITINRLAQRPSTDRTASLPQTPNPFFRNWKRGSPATSRIPSGAVTPGTDEAVRSDLHVRGPVDIVIGLEKKRQKRKEKFWRQHCRKVAKEQSERKTVPGRGVERMKELGLECAERTRAYGLGQQAKLVISL